MPRKPRIDAPGALHHIMARGVDKNEIFKDKTDLEIFLEQLGELLTETGTQCFAWALLPNHLHLLLRTGPHPISHVMHRLLTGHAVRFNRRHQRSGHLFQNRYKSILCQEDRYFLELVRYIHLNPIRAGIISTLDPLGTYPFTGHSAVIGNIQNTWQNTGFVLKHFSERQSEARKKYLAYIARGLDEGKRPDLSGGVLSQSCGSRDEAQSTDDQQPNTNTKRDARILGDSEFVQNVLQTADEALAPKYRLRHIGCDLDTAADRASELMNVSPEDIFTPGKKHKTVQARSLFCFWAVRELGYTVTELAGRLRMSQPAVSISVERGARIAQKEGFTLLPPNNL